VTHFHVRRKTSTFYKTKESAFLDSLAIWYSRWSFFVFGFQASHTSGYTSGDADTLTCALM
ncbi:MAG TPA: hypothetical protein VGE40_11305, partial [Bacilli bacterium]